MRPPSQFLIFHFKCYSQEIIQFTSICFDFFPFHLVNSVNPLNLGSQLSVFRLVDHKISFGTIRCTSLPISSCTQKLFIRRNQSWFEIIMEIMENQSNQCPPRDPFVFRFSVFFLIEPHINSTRVTPKIEQHKRNISSNAICYIALHVCLSGALKRNENHFLCMHATKYEYANTAPLPTASGAPESSNLLAPLRSASCKLVRWWLSGAAGRQAEQAAPWRQPPQPEIGSLIISEQNATGLGFANFIGSVSARRKNIKICEYLKTI